MPAPDEVWSVDLLATSQSSGAATPVLVVGPPTSFGRDFPVAIVCPLGTVDCGVSVHVGITATIGRGSKPWFVRCEMVQAVPIARLNELLATIDRVESGEVHRILAGLMGHRLSS